VPWGELKSLQGPELEKTRGEPQSESKRGAAEGHFEEEPGSPMAKERGGETC